MGPNLPLRFRLPRPQPHCIWFRFPDDKQGTLVDCPMPCCPGKFPDRTAMQRHFCHHHRGTIICVTGENAPWPCACCGQLITNHAIWCSHYNSSCRAGADRHVARPCPCCLPQPLLDFLEHGEEIENVPIFRYLVRPMLSRCRQ